MTVQTPAPHGGVERPQVQVAQGVLADRHAVVVPAPGGQPVAREVLGARGDPVGGGRVAALGSRAPSPRRAGRRARASRRGTRPPAPSAAPRRGRPSGVKVQATPSTTASDAASAATSSTRPSSKDAARPSGMGQTVRWPWMTSRPKRTGMPRRLSSTAWRCAASMLAARTPSSRSLPPVAPLAKRLDPMRPAASSAASSRARCWPPGGAGPPCRPASSARGGPRRVRRWAERGRARACWSGRRPRQDVSTTSSTTSPVPWASRSARETLTPGGR